MTAKAIGMARRPRPNGGGQMEFSIFMSVSRFRFVDADSRKEQKAAVLERAGNPRVAGQEAGRGRGPEKANRQGVGASFSCFCSNFRTGPK